jgi:hypothetical protein
VDLHACDKTLIVHVLHIIKVKMGAAAMPQSQIKGTGAGTVGRLRNDCVPVEISNILLIDRGSEDKLLVMLKADLSPLNGDDISFGAGEVE